MNKIGYMVQWETDNLPSVQTVDVLKCNKVDGATMDSYLVKSPLRNNTFRTGLHMVFDTATEAWQSIVEESSGCVDNYRKQINETLDSLLLCQRIAAYSKAQVEKEEAED